MAALALACGRWEGGGGKAPAGALELDVGLTADERDELRFLTEGSDLFPVYLLLALDDVNTGRRFVDSLERYGFLPSPRSERNPFGLPVGWTTDVPELSPNRLPYAGINCAACHSGQIDYRGRRMRIDGAPNLADLEAFAIALRDSLVATLGDPAKTLELVKRVSRELHPEAGIAAPLLIPRDTRLFLDNLEAAVDGGARDRLGRRLGEALQRMLRSGAGAPGDEALAVLDGASGDEPLRHLATALEVASRFGPIVRDRLSFGVRAIRAIEISPAAGPGRDDPWGVIRNLVFASETRLIAPASIPHLFHYRDVDWYHADGNTSSVMQRNVAQAFALGGYVDVGSGESTLRPRNLRRLEGGSWSCAACHRSRRSLLVDLETVGTDPNRALSFAEPLAGQPFDRQVVAAVDAIVATALAAAGVDPEEARSWEYRTPEWRTTRRYVARQLDGVWATAPYLHNGSVPTLADLLLPAAERPVSFPLGHREYDPERVGYATGVAAAPFRFDTRVEGNDNRGHEFGTGLGAAERADLVEYLKTL